jgi:hypothetical protein
MNATRKTMVPLVVLVTAALLGGCSDKHAPAHRPVSDVPLVTAAPASPDTSAPPIETQAGGIPSTYTAYYDGHQLSRITEQRTTSNSQQQGEYEFQGARLLRYRGAPLEGLGELNLLFDERGAVVSARKDDAPASEPEINAIRNRASLLRSHALARQATNAHGGSG